MDCPSRTTTAWNWPALTIAAAATWSALTAPLYAENSANYAPQAQAELQASSTSHRYELSRSESLLMLNIDVADSFAEKANYLHLENVFTGQTYRVKLRTGTHLVKVEAGVYKPDFDRLNNRLFAEKTLSGAAIDVPLNTELTLMPQTANFAGSWVFSEEGAHGTLAVKNLNNPAVAIAKRYPIIGNYPLQSTIGDSTRMVAMDWPLEVQEVVSFRN